MDECRLTPVELYFLGVLLNAEYIDYEYIAALPDIQNNYRVIEEQTLVLFSSSTTLSRILLLKRT